MGSSAATSWNAAGKSAWRAARETTMRPVSSGSRKASGAARGNPGSATRKRTPRWASDARLQCSADALTRFLHFGVGEADEREAGQAVGEVHLDRDGGCIEAAQGTAADECKGDRRFCFAAVPGASPMQVHRNEVRAFAWCLGRDRLRQLRQGRARWCDGALACIVRIQSRYPQRIGELGS
jgi:hypothetical protein